MNIVTAPFTFGRLTATFSGTNRIWLSSLPFVFSFLMFVVLHISALAVDGVWTLAWLSYVAYAGKFMYESDRPGCRFRVAMLLGRTAAKCGSCGKFWGKHQN